MVEKIVCNDSDSESGWSPSHTKGEDEAVVNPQEEVEHQLAVQDNYQRIETKLHGDPFYGFEQPEAEEVDKIPFIRIRKPTRRLIEDPNFQCREDNPFFGLNLDEPTIGCYGRRNAVPYFSSNVAPRNLTDWKTLCKK